MTRRNGPRSATSAGTAVVKSPDEESDGDRTQAATRVRSAHARAAPRERRIGRCEGQVRSQRFSPRCLQPMRRDHVS